MAAFIYRCPNTRVRIQALAAKAITDDANTYQLVACVMCQQVHLVNPFTGKLLGDSKKIFLANLRHGDETLMDKRD